MPPASAFTLDDLWPALERAARSLLDRQVTDPGEPGHGLTRHAVLGLPDASHGGTAHLVALGGLLAASGRWPEVPQGIRLAAEAMLRAQRPNGLTDLLDCNPDSAPDAAFIAQLWLRLLEVAEADLTRTPGGPDLVRAMDTFVRRAVPGIASGGFHTPNHRWVIASALAQARARFPDLAGETDPALDAYLAEGPDADADGFFLERSPVVYDAVSNRSLFLLERLASWREGGEAARRNLDLFRALLHPDGTVETGLSTRQDHGRRDLPLAMAACLVQARDADPAHEGLAAWLWAQAMARDEAPRASAALWLALEMRGVGMDRIGGPVPMASGAWWFPGVGLRRLRDADRSLSLFGAGPSRLRLVWGDVDILSLEVHSAIFGAGVLRPASVASIDLGLRMRFDGAMPGHRPGYELPLGRPVPPDRWDEALVQRPWRPTDPMVADLEVAMAPESVDVRFEADCASARMPLALAFEVAAGTGWDDGAGVRPLAAGETVIIPEAGGRLKAGTTRLRLEPGASEHLAPALRNIRSPYPRARLLVNLVSPARHLLRIRRDS